MKRRNFISKSLLGTAGFTAFSQLFSEKAKADRLIDSLCNRRENGSGINFVKPAIGVTPVPGWKDHPKYPGLLEYIPVWNNEQKTSRIIALRGHSGLVLPTHMHPMGELIYVVDGALNVTSHTGDPEYSEEYTMKMGDLVWVPPGTYHTKEEVKELVTVIVFEPELAIYP